MIPPSRMIPPRTKPRPNPPPAIAVLETAALAIAELETGELVIVARATVELAIAELVIAKPGYFSATFAWVRQSGLVFP